MHDSNILHLFYILVSIKCVYSCSFVKFISDKSMKNKLLVTFSLKEEYYLHTQINLYPGREGSTVNKYNLERDCLIKWTPCNQLIYFVFL